MTTHYLTAEECAHKKKSAKKKREKSRQNGRLSRNHLVTQITWRLVYKRHAAKPGYTKEGRRKHFPQIFNKTTRTCPVARRYYLTPLNLSRIVNEP